MKSYSVYCPEDDPEAEFAEDVQSYNPEAAAAKWFELNWSDNDCVSEIVVEVRGHGYFKVFAEPTVEFSARRLS